MCKYDKGKKCDRGCRYWNTCAERRVKSNVRSKRRA
nr:MAG TPA: hypothetical protein [Caudoviricetes sp.]